METITEATESPKVLVDEIKQQIATLEAQVNTLRDTIARERARVKDLYTTLNDDIESNDWTEEDTISLKDLSDHLESASVADLYSQKNTKRMLSSLSRPPSSSGQKRATLLKRLPILSD